MKNIESAPQLYFSADELPPMRRNFLENPSFQKLRESLEGFDQEAERKFMESEVNYSDHRNDTRRVCDVIQSMSFLYLMTGREDAAKMAVESVRTLMKFPFWDFFMEGDKVLGVQGAPRGAIAVATAVDWLGDRVDAAERQAWLKVLVERGCDPCFLSLHNIRYPRLIKGWSINPESIMYEERTAFPNDNARRPEITQTTNLRAAPASGLAIGAAAVKLYSETQPDSMEEWIEMTTVSIQAIADVYLPDGSYGEAVNYANYTSESIFMAIVALRHAGLANIEESINWQGHIQFMLNMAMPTNANPYEVVNIGDSGRHRGHAVFQHPDGRAESRSALPFWVAKEYGDRTAQWFGANLAASHNIWSLAFHDERIEPMAPENKAQTWYPDLDWVVARTGYRAEDFQVSLRSGIGWNHEHADRNSLIVKGYGEQLIVDPIRPPYPFTDPNWMMRTTAGHSAILIDGKGHFYNNGVEGTNSTHAQARLVGRGEGQASSYWISDATQAYRIADLEIKNVVRAVVVFFDLRAVVVVDRVAQYHEPAKVEARFFADNWEGDATVSTTDDGFKVTRPGAYAQAKVWGRDELDIREDKLPIPVERAAKHPFVAVETVPTMSTTLVTAIAVGQTGEAAAESTFEADDDGITVTFDTPQGAQTCRIDDRDMVPVIEIKDQ